LSQRTSSSTPQPDRSEPTDPAAQIAGEFVLLAYAPGAAVDRELLAAYAAAPNSLRAFRSDVTAFDTWRRFRACGSLPASAQVVAEFLKARAGEGAAAASLTRYRASIAKLHRLCHLPDPCQDELVKLTLAAYRRDKARAAKARVNPNDRGWNARWDPTWFTGKDATPARVEYDVGDDALHPGSVTPIFREILRRAFEGGAFGDLDAKVFAEQLAQISAHSTRVGINQDYFAAGENLAGIMDALRSMHVMMARRSRERAIL
jgi:hypothetical protein